MGHLFSLAIDSIFINNILLSLFLGMCSFLGIGNSLKASIGIGVAVVVVLTITVPTNWFLLEYILKPGALSWAGFGNVDLSYLTFLAFIAVIASQVQLIEMLLEKYIPSLYTSLGIFLPLIAVNCAILGASLFMEQREYDFAESVVFGFSSGFGWFLAIVLFSSILQKLKYAHSPDGLKGFGVNMITAGLIAMSFMAFAGLKI